MYEIQARLWSSVGKYYYQVFEIPTNHQPENYETSGIFFVGPGDVIFEEIHNKVEKEGIGILPMQFLLT